MKAVYACTFSSPKNIDEVLASATSLPGYVWLIAESEHDGRYVRGTSRDGTRVRVVDEGARMALELYFPRALERGELTAEAFASLKQRLLPLLEARDVVDE